MPAIPVVPTGPGAAQSPLMQDPNGPPSQANLLMAAAALKNREDGQPDKIPMPPKNTGTPPHRRRRRV